MGDTAQAQQIGIFGGTFDPIHVGHLVIAQEAAAQLRLDRVLFIPAGQPPHKNAVGISPSQDRRRMVELAIQDNPLFALSTIELDHPGLNYTVETLARLRQVYGPTAAFTLIMGGDMVMDLPHWRDPAGIIRQVANIAALHRPGAGFTEERIASLDAQAPGLRAVLRPIAAPQLDISSTQLRARVAEGKPIRYLVPTPVVQYIYEHQLYSAHTDRAEEHR